MVVFTPPDAFADLSDSTVEEVASDIGWRSAVTFHDKLKRAHDPRQKAKIRKAAAATILEKAKSTMGAVARPYILKAQPWSEYPDRDLDLDYSLEEDPLLDTLWVETREDKRAEVVICLDTSLSMTGRKFALLGVTVGTLALQLRSDDLSIINFESEARKVKGLGQVMSPFTVVEKFIESPAKGLTNMEAALKLALKETQAGRLSKRHVILMSDGRFTAGARPDYLIPQLPRLHVVQTGNPWSHNRFFRRMAKLGNGKFLQVAQFEHLPKALYALIQEILR